MIRLRVALWIAAGLLIVVGAEWKLLHARNAVLARRDDPSLAAAWEAWRRDAARQDGELHDGEQYPVERKTPRSERPPAVVMLTEHYPALAIGMAFGILAPFTFLAVVTEASLRQQRREFGGEGASAGASD